MSGRAKRRPLIVRALRNKQAKVEESNNRACLFAEGLCAKLLLNEVSGILKNRAVSSNKDRISFVPFSPFLSFSFFLILLEFLSNIYPLASKVPLIISGYQDLNLPYSKLLYPSPLTSPIEMNQNMALS
jgi:hypothetical protein